MTKDPMTKDAWMVTFLQRQDSLYEGLPWPFTTEPPRMRAVSYNAAGERYHRVRRRSDGEPYTRQWQAGEDVFIYHPESGRIVAWLTLDGPAVWDAEDERFETDSTVVIHAPNDGPTLDDIGVEVAVHGGVQRLTPSQHGAAVQGLRNSAAHLRGERFEALALRAVAKRREGFS